MGSYDILWMVLENIVMVQKGKKQAKALASDARYEGKYVAVGVGGKDIIASGKNPGTVIKKARDKGVASPAIVFVPEKGVTCVY